MSSNCMGFVFFSKYADTCGPSLQIAALHMNDLSSAVLTAFTLA
jgi:hypothetical protein